MIDDKTLQFVNAFFRISECVNRFTVQADGIFVHFEYQPWMGNTRYLNISKDEDSEPLVTFTGSIIGQQGQIEATANWNGKGIESVKTALTDPNKVCVEFLRPDEMPDTVPAIMKDAFVQQDIDDETKLQITAQICEGLRERL